MGGSTTYSLELSSKVSGRLPNVAKVVAHFVGAEVVGRESNALQHGVEGRDAIERLQRGFKSKNVDYTVLITSD